jgi:multidrug transporter EmrE-like cation transporter
MLLALSAAVLHAVFAAMQKGRINPWVMRGAMDASYGLMALPFALFVVPWPEPHLWPILAGAWAIHTVYKVLQAMAFTRGAYTVVYPVVRGSGPFFTVIGAYLLFGEVFTVGQWLGVAVLLCGIFGLAVYNMRTVTLERETLGWLWFWRCSLVFLWHFIQLMMPMASERRRILLPSWPGFLWSILGACRLWP